MTDQENQGRAAKWLILSALVVLVDQLSKSYITGHYGEFEFTTVLPILDITCMHNVGAAFSFLAGASGWQRWLFIVLAVGVSVAHHRLAVSDAPVQGFAGCGPVAGAWRGAR